MRARSIASGQFRRCWCSIQAQVRGLSDPTITSIGSSRWHGAAASEVSVPVGTSVLARYPRSKCICTSCVDRAVAFRVRHSAWMSIAFCKASERIWHTSA
jgi:hypothetical protein